MIFGQLLELIQAYLPFHGYSVADFKTLPRVNPITPKVIAYYTNILSE